MTEENLKLDEPETTPEALEEESQQEAPETTFESLGVSEKLSSLLGKKGWRSPTEIQAKSLPHSLKGKDVAGFAQTGTGKTGAFLITFAELFLKRDSGAKRKPERPQALILCPTRELAIQIKDEAESLFEDLGVKTEAIYGGASLENQSKALKEGVDLVASTPGRLLDLANQGLIHFDAIEVFICDEVDRMFDMGFSKDVDAILSKLPDGVQRLAFSATLDDRARELCTQNLNDPVFVSLNEGELTPEAIQQNAIICESNEKIKLLLAFLREHNPVCALIFANTKVVTSWLAFKLEKNNFEAEMISGDLPQGKRTKLIEKIKEGKTKILIATDVASRGLHIPNVSHVYNFDLPDDPANYVHRIGRTARAGATGASYSFICADYADNFEGIQKLLGDKAPKATHLDPAFIEGVEDLGTSPFGKRSPRPPMRRYESSSFDRRPPSGGSFSRSQERPGGDRDRRPAGRPSHREANKPQNRSFSTKPQNTKTPYKKSPRKFSTKKKASKGFLGKILGSFFGKK